MCGFILTLYNMKNTCKMLILVRTFFLTINLTVHPFGNRLSKLFEPPEIKRTGSADVEFFYH